MPGTTTTEDIRTNRTLGDNDEEHTIGDQPAVPNVDELPEVIDDHADEIADRLDWTADVHRHHSDNGNDSWMRDEARAFHRLATRLRDGEPLDDGDYERVETALEYYAENVDQTDWDVIQKSARYFS